MASASALTTEPTYPTFNIQPSERPRGIITETDRGWFDKNPSDISLDINTSPRAPPHRQRPSSFTQVEATQDRLQHPTTPQMPLLSEYCRGARGNMTDNLEGLLSSCIIISAETYETSLPDRADTKHSGSVHLTPTSCGRETVATRGIGCLLTDQHTGKDFRRHRRVVTPRDKDTANSVEYPEDSRSLGYTNGDPTPSSNSEEPIRWTVDSEDDGDKPRGGSRGLCNGISSISNYSKVCWITDGGLKNCETIPYPAKMQAIRQQRINFFCRT